MGAAPQLRHSPIAIRRTDQIRSKTVVDLRRPCQLQAATQSGPAVYLPAMLSSVGHIRRSTGISNGARFDLSTTMDLAVTSLGTGCLRRIRIAISAPRQPSLKPV